ncbi:MAG: MAPEG family protein [Formosimonas sp.]
MLLAHWMLLVASFLPIVAAAAAKISQGGYDNHHPRDFLDKLPAHSVGKRLVAAQSNAWEALMMFAPALLLASWRGVDGATLNLWASVFIAARVAHMLCYAKNWASARSAMWFVGVFAIVRLYIAAANVA